MENKIEFRTQTNQIQDSWVMRITSDRRIEVNEDVEVTEAAHKVLEALQHMLTPQRKPLTGEQIERILASQPNGEHTNLHWFFNAVRDVETAHGIKE